jgi:hypothetical protein
MDGGGELFSEPWVSEGASHATCVILNDVSGKGLLLVAFAERVHPRGSQELKNKG